MWVKVHKALSWFRKLTNIALSVFFNLNVILGKTAYSVVGVNELILITDHVKH